MSRLFRAKSKSDCSVLQHCQEVRQVAEAIWESIEHELAEATGIDGNELRQDLRPLLLAAALLHDLGTVNSAFQSMLEAKPGDGRRQPVRHEILSGWLLADSDFYGDWFAGLRTELDIWPVIWAVVGHHLKMGDPARGGKLFDRGSGTKQVRVPVSETDVRELLQGAAAVLGSSITLPQIAEARFDTADDEDDSLEQRIERFADVSYRAWKRLRRNPEAARRTALLKALLVSADVAGSALTADEGGSAQWVPRALSERLTSEALDPIITKGTKGKEPLPFQEYVGKSGPATIVIAGCGNGKTTAAYMWARRHAQGRKLWFTYPTTGTASAGYQGYLFDHPDLRTELMHGRAEVDLRAMRGTAEDDRYDETIRLESLRAWDRQAIACTVDTVLGLLQNQRRPLFSFPAIVSGAFVFDEIHSYDGRMFGSLLRFLELFPGVPVLLMSASIPPGRMAALRKVLGDRLGDDIRGDPSLEGLRRYRLEARSSSEACRDEVKATLQEKKKVLWVCNTVTSAVEVACNARDWADIAPEDIIIYHSRFRYRDRVDRQNGLITRFRGAGPILAVTTQVCEMSLDISADLMVTAECPLPSLVQRLGRLNRYATKDDPWPCLVYPFQGEPYNEQAESVQIRGDYRVSMAACREAVRDLTGAPCSQKDLAARLGRMIKEERIEKYSAWIDDGWLSEPLQLREGDASITLIREEDLADIEQELGPEHAKPSKWTHRSLVPWTIPMFYRRGFQPARPAGGYPVAAMGAVAYSLEEGATWQTKTK